eukprot:8317585-Pyramimonas_sp.AAC.1
MAPSSPLPLPPRLSPASDGAHSPHTPSQLSRPMPSQTPSAPPPSLLSPTPKRPLAALAATNAPSPRPLTTPTSPSPRPLTTLTLPGPDWLRRRAGDAEADGASAAGAGAAGVPRAVRPSARHPQHDGGGLGRRLGLGLGRRAARPPPPPPPHGGGLRHGRLGGGDGSRPGERPAPGLGLR